MTKPGRPDWTLKEMEALHHVVQLGTATAAAARMGISQPAVSRLLSSLEGKLARPLFERQGRSLRPTQAALEFFDASVRVFDAIDSMRYSPGLAQRSETLRIAAPPSYASGFLQEAVALFLRTHLHINIQIDVRSSPAIFELVSEGGADLGLTDTAPGHEAVRATPFRRARMGCFMRKDHPLARERIVDIARCDRLDVVGLSRRHATREYVDRLMERLGCTQKVAVETSTAESAIAFVERIGVVAFLSPFPVAGFLPSDVTFRPVVSDLSHVSHFVYPARPGLTPLTRRFMKTVTQVSQAHDAWSESIGLA